MALEALTKRLSYGRLAVACCALAVLCSTAAIAARYRTRHAPAHHEQTRPIPYPELEMPLQIDGSQYSPLAWSDIAGWSDDDQLAAYKTFRTSCRPIVAQHAPPPDNRKALGSSLREPCRFARANDLDDSAKARAFFMDYFVPLQISRLGEDAGFVTGYYEPIIDGSLTRTDTYNVPVYRRPSNLFVRGYSQSATNLPNSGPVYRKIGRRKLVPYYDRAEIEDGAIAGRGLEICWLKSQTDLLFAQIQGSARIHLQDGSFVRINYDAHNGYPYTPVGRVLINRGIIPREQMSRQKIVAWMDQNPDGAKELRRQNRAFVFFRVVQLSSTDEAVGGQGVPLTPGRSIAVDQALHVYGTPFFIEGTLPIESEQSKTPFRRLMIAQDTGSAIVGPARADLYFGAGNEAGQISGRLRHNMRFVILVPKSLDPASRGRKMPLPDARPSQAIAKLFPQTDHSKDPAKDASKDAPKDQPKAGSSAAAAPAQSPNDAAKPADPKNVDPVSAHPATAVAQIPATPGTAKAVPLPEARPEVMPATERRYHRRHRQYRRVR